MSPDSNNKNNNKDKHSNSNSSQELLNHQEAAPSVDDGISNTNNNKNKNNKSSGSSNNNTNGNNNTNSHNNNHHERSRPRRRRRNSYSSGASHSQASHSNHATGVGSVAKSRLIFLLSLVLVALALALAAHHLLAATETRLAREQFDLVATSALQAARKIVERQTAGLVTLASIVEQTLPDATAWPTVHVPGFATMAQNVMLTSDGRSMGFLPIVRPVNKSAFEAYAMEHLAELTPHTTNRNRSTLPDRMYGLDATWQQYNETTEAHTYWNSSYNIYTPFYQHSSSDVFFLLNWHSLQARGELVDFIMDCATIRKQEMIQVPVVRNGDNSSVASSFTPRSCSVVTDIIDLSFRTPIETPAAVSVQPIYPAHDPTELVGFITSAIQWEVTLTDVFSADISGVDCVLQTDSQADGMVFTYEIQHGLVTLKGQGDLHDDNFDAYAHTVVLSGPSTLSSSSSSSSNSTKNISRSPTYTLTAYPNAQFLDVYQTDNPFIATIGSVCIMIFTSILFLCYDWFVRTEFQHARRLTQARKQFVRFISHEVRTPLNAVCMGLQLSLIQQQQQFLHHYNNDTGNDDAEQQRQQQQQHQHQHQQQQYAHAQENITILENDILSNAHCAVDVLNDLLNYDKVESGTLQLELAVVDVFDVIAKTVCEFQQPAKSKKIDYSLDFGPLWTFHHDQVQQELRDHEHHQQHTNMTQGGNTADINKNGGVDEELGSNSVAVSATHTPLDCARSLPKEIKNRKVIGDTSRLSQVVRNLISNALKFTPEGGKLEIRTSILPSTASTTSPGSKSKMNDHHHPCLWKRKRNTRASLSSEMITLYSGETLKFVDGGLLQLEVQDTGAGMTSDQVKNVFKEGVQFNVNELQAGQGSGLGLFIAKGILVQHGGSLAAFSGGKGSGTTFTMTLPLHYVPEDPSSSSNTETALRGKAVHWDTMESLNILVVDDSKVNRKMLSRLLQSHGHVCAEAEDGRVAVDKVIQAAQEEEQGGGGRRFDAILMDYDMPVLDGGGAAKAIRDLGCDSFIVGITGTLFSEDVDNFKKCGANAVLPKPLELRNLMDILVENGVASVHLSERLHDVVTE